MSDTQPTPTPTTTAPAMDGRPNEKTDLIRPPTAR